MSTSQIYVDHPPLKLVAFLLYLLFYWYVPIYSVNAQQSTDIADFSDLNERQADSLLDDYVSRINQLRRVDIEEALNELKVAFQLLDYHPSISHQIKLLNLRGFCFGTSGRFDAAFSDFDLALELARENPAGQRIGEIYGFRGVTHYYKGDMPNALSDYTRAIDEFTAANDKEGLSLYLNNLAIIQKFYGQYELALSQYVRSAKLNQASGRDDRLTYNYNNIGILYYELERYSEAENYVLKAYQLYQKVGDELGGANALNNLAYINLYLGKITQARDYAKRAMAIYLKNDSEQGRSSVLSVYAEINIETRAGDDTYELLEEAIATRKKFQSNQTLAENYVQLGRWAMIKKDFARSERSFNLAWELAEKNVYTSEKKAVRKYLAELYQMQGRFEEALAQVRMLNQLEAEISKDTNKNNMQFLQSRFDLEQSQRSYQLLLEQTKVNELLEKQQRFTLILIIALIIFALCVFAYYWRRSVVARRDAIKSAEEKSDFLALMSHELRTPMNGVIGAATALENSDSEWEKQQTVSIIKSSGQRLLSLVNDILDLSKIEAGKMELDCAEFSLRECIEETMELFMFQMGTKQVELVYFINNPYEDLMHGDSNKIKQILINLIGNSIKFTEAGEVLLRIDVELDRETLRTTHSNFYIKCQVKDTGVGISEEQCKKLFNAYTQVDSKQHSVVAGTGLGLTISRELVELMDGRIEVQSELGKGTTFNFNIIVGSIIKHAEQTDASEVNGDAGMSHYSDNDNYHLHKCIAVVSNHPLRSLQVKNDLALCGAKVNLFDSAETCCTHLRTTEHDLVIIDESIQHDSNSSAYHLIKSALPYPPKFILLTDQLDAFSQTGADKQSENLKLYDEFVLKPFKKKLLVKSCANVLGVRNGKQITHSSESNIKKPLSDTKSLNVLLVEDNVINQRILTSIFLKMGIDIDIASGGKEAIKMVSESDYQLCFMDFIMPDMNGDVASEQILALQEPANKPIIIGLTASSSPEDERRCRESGMQDLLTKPVTLSALQDRVDYWLKRLQ